MKGFTLIEMLVSVAIFSTVMTMALGALLALSVADRKAETLKSGIDNLTFALDSMSRSIRTGQNYHCGAGGVATTPQDCYASGIGNTYLTFLASNGVQTYYQLDNAQDGTSLCGQTLLPYGCIERKLGAGGAWIPITSPDLVILSTGYLFKVVGSLPSSTGDTVQPKVVITVSATVPVSATQNTAVHMQTAVTQRIYDQ
jgi:prepilin-type N-terminal cleavage/methylation domain-containing protein